MDGGDAITDAKREAVLSRNLGADEAVSQAVVGAIAAVTGQDVLELEPTLYNSLDPDALDSLFAGRSSRNDPESRIVFAYAGFVLEVYADRRIAVCMAVEQGTERGEANADA